MDWHISATPSFIPSSDIAWIACRLLYRKWGFIWACRASILDCISWFCSSSIRVTWSESVVCMVEKALCNVCISRISV